MSGMRREVLVSRDPDVENVPPLCLFLGGEEESRCEGRDERMTKD